MLQLRIFFCRECCIYVLFCREWRDYALFDVEFYAEFLEEILRNTQNFGRNSAEKIGDWSLWYEQKNVRSTMLGNDAIGKFGGRS